MNDSLDHIPDEAGNKPPDDRLESWKRISNYLKRDIRTLRRWEKNEGLPIHRHMHESQATVYAYKSELDHWLASRSAGATKASNTVQARPSVKRRWLVALSVILAVISVALVMKIRPGKVELPFEARDWILITRFDNRTGEDVFDGTLEYALQRELSNSQYVNVVSRERISDTLAMMKLPADSVIDKTIGREISLRDGGSKALMTGRLEKLGESYLIGTELVEPGSGVAVASFSKTVTGQDFLAPAIHDLANEVRVTLGETLADIETDSTALEKVTTPSLRALQLYSQADALFIEYKSQAHQLLLQAVEIDPDFASAHVLLGYTYKSWGDKEQSDFHYQRAMDLADGVSERERYFIQSSYYSYQDFNQAKAINVLELLLRKYPDHYWANSRLEWIYRGQGQPLRALPYTLRRVDLRPNNYIHQILAVRRLLATGSERNYQAYLESAESLASQNWQRMQLRALNPKQSWLKGDISETHNIVMRLQQEAEADPGKFNFSLAWQAANLYLALGKLKEARSLLLKFDPELELFALSQLAQGDHSALQPYFAGTQASYQVVILLARIGKTENAEVILEDPTIRDRISAPFHLPSWEGLARGELAMAQGQFEAAITHLKVPYETPPMWPTAYYFLGLQSLANALVQSGETQEAIKILEHSGQQLAESIFWDGATMFWMNNQSMLMDLYNQTGKLEKAEEIAIKLRALLKVADQDHPVLLNANSN